MICLTKDYLSVSEILQIKLDWTETLNCDTIISNSFRKDFGISTASAPAPMQFLFAYEIYESPLLPTFEERQAGFPLATSCLCSGRHSYLLLLAPPHPFRNPKGIFGCYYMRLPLVCH